MYDYDLCVIGGGPSGYAAAMRAMDFDKKVLLVEKTKLGGAGIHNGALSSKTWWEIARNIENARMTLSRHGAGGPSIPFADIARDVDLAVRKRMQQLEHQVERYAAEGLKGSLEFMQGHGTMTTSTEVEISNGDKTSTVTAENIILATGSRPRHLPFIQVDEQIIMTSDGIVNLTEYPESLVILGAGVIGCEFATIFAHLGHTKVFLIDKADRILPFEDEDVGHVVEHNLESRGVNIHRRSRLERMEVKDGQVEYELKYQDGRREVHHVEKALIAVGRVPNIENLGIDKVGLAQTKYGHIDDQDTQTSIPNIFAVGDLTADIALVNVGELEGRHAVERIWSDKPNDLCYENISTIMFLCPEVAGVGMNEKQAQEKGIAYKVVSLDFNYIPRAIAMRNTEGFFKILVSDDEEMKVLGMRAIGEHASSAIQAVALLISMGKGIEELAEMVHPHPSIIEGVQECVRMLLGKSILKPTHFHDLKCRRWVDGRYKGI